MALLIDNLISTMFSFKFVGKIHKLINTEKLRKVIYVESPEKEPQLNYFFVYRTKKEKELSGEEYNVAGKIFNSDKMRVPNSEITDAQAIEWYIKTLDAFNNDLRGNQPRKFVRAYKITAVIKLEKLVTE